MVTYIRKTNNISHTKKCSSAAFISSCDSWIDDQLIVLKDWKLFFPIFHVKFKSIFDSAWGPGII